MRRLISGNLIMIGLWNCVAIAAPQGAPKSDSVITPKNAKTKTKHSCRLGPVPDDDYAIDPSVRRLFRDMTVIDGRIEPSEHTSCCVKTYSFCTSKHAHKDHRCYERKTYEDYRVISSRTGIHIGTFAKELNSSASTEHAHGKNVRLILTSNDIDAARSQGQFGLIMAIETWSKNHDEMSPSQLFGRGLRIVQLAQSAASNQKLNTVYAGGADQDEMELTPAGRTLANQLLDNFVLLDVSHMGRTSALHLAELARDKNRPIIASQSNIQSVFDDSAETDCGTGPSRNHSNKVVCAIAETGGIIGLTPIQSQLSPKQKVNGKCVLRPASENDFIMQIDTLAKNTLCQTRTGQRIDMTNHVGISSGGSVNGYPPKAEAVYTRFGSRYNRWMRIASRLKKECRYTVLQLAKVFGGNFERVYRQGLPGLQPPVPLNPRNHRRVRQSKVRFSWKAPIMNSPADRPITQANRYALTIQRRMRGKNRRYKTIDVGTSRQHSISLPKGRYRWTVQASNGAQTVKSNWHQFSR